ncbi:alpha/beta hydrolase [Gaoshiqia sp. Z1-71]|uniref:alpha/beta hydrolase n=1 Tax=Gaoshiqia hydrogeniformans TaxID=3290090 RepID=UPI003BF85383
MIKKAWLGMMLLSHTFFSFSQEYLPLWPGAKMPNSKGLTLERIEERERITQIDVPGMSVFLSSKEENTGAAVLIFPPGGYQKMAYNIAGLQLAKWFNTFGVNAFVVLYRLPTSPDLKEPAFGPVTDGQRALKLVRAHAPNWGINPDRIGVMGCSAGGGLTANMATFTTDYAAIGDSLDSVSVRPDFQIIVSGAISMKLDAHQGSHDALLGKTADEKLEALFSGELNVTAQTSPAFITCAANDPVVNPMNSLRYFEALQKAGVSSCLHIFPKGEHSIALRNNPGSTNLWTSLCEAWLKELGITEENK